LPAIVLTPGLRRDLEIVLFGIEKLVPSIVPPMKKPFGVHAEGLFAENSRATRRRLSLFSGSFQEWTKSLFAVLPAVAT
jgi:hypothetical protein